MRRSVTQEAAPLAVLYVTYAIVRGDARTYTLQIVTRDDRDGVALSVTHITVDRSSGKALRSVIQRPKGVIATPESGLRPLRESSVSGGRPEEIQVPGGRYATVRGRVGDAEVWVSDRAPGLGVVRAVWASGTLELIQGATSGAMDLLPLLSR
jgi:hypothetical protein